MLSRAHQASILLNPPYRVLYHPLLAPPSGARTPTEAALACRATTVVSPRTPTLPPPITRRARPPTAEPAEVCERARSQARA